jgi:hypothetical protein
MLFGGKVRHALRCWNPDSDFWEWLAKLKQMLTTSQLCALH